MKMNEIGREEGFDVMIRFVVLRQEGKHVQWCEITVPDCREADNNPECQKTCVGAKTQTLTLISAKDYCFLAMAL